MRSALLFLGSGGPGGAVLAPFWLGWQDSNLRMPESKSGALPLGDIPISGKQAEIVQIVLCLPRLVAPGKAILLYGVSDGTRTHGLQSHNLTR